MSIRNKPAVLDRIDNALASQGKCIVKLVEGKYEVIVTKPQCNYWLEVIYPEDN